MRYATPLVVLVGALGISSATVLAQTAPARTPAVDVGAADAATGASTSDPAHADRPCFRVFLPEWAAGFHDDSLTGWASVDRTARFAGTSCHVTGWAPDPCGQKIAVYLASCPDGAFTFTRTESECYSVLGCRDPHATAGYGASR